MPAIKVEQIGAFIDDVHKELARLLLGELLRARTGSLEGDRLPCQGDKALIDAKRADVYVDGHVQS